MIADRTITENGSSPLVTPAGCYHLVMSEPAPKLCIHCGTTFPHTREHFAFSKRDGLSSVCKRCQREKNKLAVKKATAKRKSNLRAIEAAGIDLYSKLAQSGGSNIPHSAELVEKVCEYFGGVAGFAAIMVKQYYDAKPGTSTRNKLLETISRLIQSNVDAGGAKKPLTLWTEEELEAELKDRFQQAVLAQRLVIDAPKTTDAPPGEPAEDSADSCDDAASSGENQGTASGATGAEGRSPPSIQPDSGSGANPPLHGE